MCFCLVLGHQFFLETFCWYIFYILETKCNSFMNFGLNGGNFRWCQSVKKCVYRTIFVSWIFTHDFGNSFSQLRSKTHDFFEAYIFAHMMVLPHSHMTNIERKSLYSIFANNNSGKRPECMPNA